MTSRLLCREHLGGTGPRKWDIALASCGLVDGGLLHPDLRRCAVTVALEDPALVVGVPESVQGLGLADMAAWISRLRKKGLVKVPFS